MNNNVPPEQQQAQAPWSFETIAAYRRHFMDGYFESQAQMALMDNDNTDDDGRRSTQQPLVATNGGHTVETAIEITEEEDGIDDDDDVIVLT